jgi:hypothetical protein
MTLLSFQVCGSGACLPEIIFTFTFSQFNMDASGNAGVVWQENEWWGKI